MTILNVSPFADNLLLLALWLRDCRSDIESISWYAQTFPRRCWTKSECISLRFGLHNEFLDNFSKSSRNKWGNVFFCLRRISPVIYIPIFPNYTLHEDSIRSLWSKKEKRDCIHLTFHFIIPVGKLPSFLGSVSSIKCCKVNLSNAFWLITGV